MAITWILLLSMICLYGPALGHDCDFSELLSDYNGYISYGVGNMPLIISAPHGGDLRPDGLPRRGEGCLVHGDCVYSHSCGATSRDCRVTTTKDSYTLDIAQGLQAEVEALTGRRPHLIANLLHRSILDANRDLDEASFGVPEVVDAYHNYTMFVETARTSVWSSPQSRGLFLDIHGQTHAEEWVELGYRIHKTDLNSGDYSASDSSIRSLADRRGCHDNDCFRDLIAGSNSLGGFLVRDGGYRVVPSPNDPSPGSGGYYRGGFNTETYGSRLYGNTDAIQIEMPRSVRFGDRQAFIRVLARAVVEFMLTYAYI